jgi:hypothetical protein
MKKFLFAFALCAAAVVSCEKMVSIEGRVTDANSGKPIAGVRVLPFALDTIILTDSTGRYKLPPVLSRPGTIKFNAANYEPLDVQFKPRGGRKPAVLDVELEKKPVDVIY